MRLKKIELDRITEAVIGAAIEVHRELGPGLLESAYEECLEIELNQQGMHVERQKALPLVYKGRRIESAYRIDLLVEKAVIVELKAVEALIPLHLAQTMCYLKLSGLHVGLLLNFNVRYLKDGLKRVARGFPE